MTKHIYKISGNFNLTESLELPRPHFQCQLFTNLDKLQLRHQGCGYLLALSGWQTRRSVPRSSNPVPSLGRHRVPIPAGCTDRSIRTDLWPESDRSRRHAVLWTGMSGDHMACIHTLPAHALIVRCWGKRTSTSDTFWAVCDRAVLFPGGSLPCVCWLRWTLYKCDMKLPSQTEKWCHLQTSKEIPCAKSAQSQNSKHTNPCEHRKIRKIPWRRTKKEGFSLRCWLKSVLCFCVSVSSRYPVVTQ